MKKLFAGSLSIILFICCSGSVLGFQKKRRTATKRTRPPVETTTREPITIAESPKPPTLDVKPANSEEAKIISFVQSINSFTAEVVKTVDEAKNKANGVDEAQKLMTARKDEIKAKFAGIKCIPETKVSDRVKLMVRDHFFYDGYTIGQLQANYGSDPIVLAKLQKLTADFLDLFMMEGGQCPKHSLAAR